MMYAEATLAFGDGTTHDIRVRRMGATEQIEWGMRFRDAPEGSHIVEARLDELARRVEGAPCTGDLRAWLDSLGVQAVMGLWSLVEGADVEVIPRPKSKSAQS